MARVDEVLAQVGLLGRDREPVRRFSLGMKQRLGIAVALLTDPDLLILDEPTNGLDPAGIVEIRELLRRLAQGGRTVVVSSHLLSELETICTYLVIIRFGELLFAGPITELLRADRRPHRLRPGAPGGRRPSRRRHAGRRLAGAADRRRPAGHRRRAGGRREPRGSRRRHHARASLGVAGLARGAVPRDDRQVRRRAGGRPDGRRRGAG